MGTKILYGVLVVLLFIVVGVLGWRCWDLAARNTSVTAILAQEQSREKELEFARLFVSKVIQPDKEIDFETRLDLENRVRAFNNPAILESWNRFTGSQNEVEAQTEAKKLLLMLIK